LELITTALGVVLGGFITIGTALLVENLRKPRLEVAIESPPQDSEYQGRPAQRSRYLRVLVSNQRLPWWAAWLMRESASGCRAEITFHDYASGRRVFSSPMDGRWASSPEPVPLVGNLEGRLFQLFDLGRSTAVTTIDIFPGDKPEPLDIAARFDDHTECFPWNNENYFSSPVWRNPNRLLPRGQYLVHVTVLGAG
jgi:hypothetical protein